jgi:hypothetical protein
LDILYEQIFSHHEGAKDMKVSDYFYYKTFLNFVLFVPFVVMPAFSYLLAAQPRWPVSDTLCGGPK